jgi:dGTPase
VTRLERRYAGFDGLNLTWEALEGLAKHNGPLIDAAGRPTGSATRRGVAREITEYSARQDLRLGEFASAEAQAGAIADDIAYDAHDIDDGLRAAMFAVDDLRELPLLRDILGEIGAQHPGLSSRRQFHELVRRLITRMIEDVIACSRQRIAALGPAGSDDIRRAGAAVVAFSPAMAAADRAIKDFLFPRMYRHPRVMRIMGDAEAVVRALFARYQRDPGELPWRRGEPERGPAPLREIADFIAGMTDRYALSEHARLFDSTPELR